jgi:hypothetical protein
MNHFPSRGTFILILSCSLLAPLACESPTAEQEGSGGSGGTPEQMAPSEGEGGAESTCGDFSVEGCDSPCSVTAPCPVGLYCSAGFCAVDCVKDSDCGSEDECSVDGRCRPVSNIHLDPKMTDPKKTDPEGPACVEGEVEFEEVVPQVWLLLDRSGSMSETLDGISRWDALGRVLLGDPEDFEDRGVVGDFEDRVAFGATFYTTGGSSTCVLDLESVALARNSYNDIRHRYNQLGPTGGTPTAESIAAVVANASVSDLTGGPKILVLATDGAPGGCSASTIDPESAVEEEVSKAYQDDIRTFAISISTGTSAPHMQRVANLGVGLEADADPPAPFYTAENQDELKGAFSTILEDLPRSCTFSLNGEVDPENADEGTVTLAGTELTYQDPDGWVLPQVNQVELVGAACDQIRAGEEDLDITFPCSVFTPIVK